MLLPFNPTNPYPHHLLSSLNAKQSTSDHGASSIFASNPPSCQAMHFGTSATSAGFSSNPFGPTLTAPSPFGAPSLFGSTGGPPPSPPPPGAGAPSFEEERWNFAACQNGSGTEKRTTNSFTLAPNPTEDFAGDKLADDIEEMMPRLRHWDYYIKPKIEELVRRERANPGFCQNVNDFVIGQHRYGSIKFLGPTHIESVVRWLDIESVVQFKDQEVAVYKDEHKKPAVGKGLNKAAEITLLNVKCVDNKTGKIHVDGPRVDDYERILKKAAADRGAEFVSFDPVKGEWKTRVDHF